MRRIIAALAVVTLLSACERASAPPPAPTPAPDAPPAVAPEAPAAPAAPEAPAPAAPEAVVTPPPAASEGTDATIAGAELPKELDGAVEPSVTTDKLKELIGNLNIDTVKALADKILQAIQGQEGVAKNLGDQIAGLSLTDLTKSAELKSSLETTTTTIAGLKDKLKAVVDKLTASGVDISKYTAFLNK